MQTSNFSNQLAACRAEGTGPATVALLLYLMNQVALLTIRVAQLSFGAATSLLTATNQVVPPGFGTTTLAAGNAAGYVIENDKDFSSIEAEFVGDVSNVDDQTVLFDLAINGAVVASTAVVATNLATQQKVSADFARVTAVKGDLVQVWVRPSAPLTAAITNIRTAIG